MSSFLCVFGLLFGLAVFCVLVIKGIHIAFASILCVFIIMIFNGVDLTSTWGLYWESVGMLSGVMLPLYLFGALFSQVMMDTGAAKKLALYLMKGVDKIAKTPMDQKNGYNRWCCNYYSYP